MSEVTSPIPIGTQPMSGMANRTDKAWLIKWQNWSLSPEGLNDSTLLKMRVEKCFTRWTWELLFDNK